MQSIIATITDVDKKDIIAFFGCIFNKNIIIEIANKQDVKEVKYCGTIGLAISKSIAKMVDENKRFLIVIFSLEIEVIK